MKKLKISDIIEEDRSSLAQTGRKVKGIEWLNLLRTINQENSQVLDENSIASLFNSNLTRRLSNALVRYDETQNNWGKTIEKFKKKRNYEAS
jgi:regulator of replication initiation timing